MEADFEREPTAGNPDRTGTLPLSDRKTVCRDVSPKRGDHPAGFYPAAPVRTGEESPRRDPGRDGGPHFPAGSGPAPPAGSASNDFTEVDDDELPF